MKSILRFTYVLTLFAASSASAHSICQYLKDEAECNANFGCVWVTTPKGPGRCVYQRSLFGTAFTTDRELTVRGIGTAKSEELARAKAVQNAKVKCRFDVDQKSKWEEKWIFIHRGSVEFAYIQAQAEFICAIDGQHLFRRIDLPLE
jgi:hypothetical protein